MGVATDAEFRKCSKGQLLCFHTAMHKDTMGRRGKLSAHLPAFGPSIQSPQADVEVIPKPVVRRLNLRSPRAALPRRRAACKRSATAASCPCEVAGQLDSQSLNDRHVHRLRDSPPIHFRRACHAPHDAQRRDKGERDSRRVMPLRRLRVMRRMTRTSLVTQ